MFTRRALLGALAVTTALTLATGCTDSGSGSAGKTEQLPDGASLLAKSAQTMKSVQSTHFKITVDGDLGGISVQSAEGDLTQSGSAAGNAKVKQGDQLVQIDFTLVGSTLWVKGPTGGYQKLPAALAASVYDPSAILNPDKGVAKVLASVSGAKTESSTGDGYVVSGKVPKDVVTSLVPGIDTDVTGKFTVTKDDRAQLVKASLDVPSGGKSATVDVVLSDLNKPVTITAPQ